MNASKQQPRQMLETPNMIAQTDTQTFKVKSMTTPDKYYIASRTGNGLYVNAQTASTANLTANTFTSY